MRILVVTLLVGCAPRAGTLRPEHPWLRQGEGGNPLAPTGAHGMLFDDSVPDDDDDIRAERQRIADVAAGQVGGGAVVANGERFRLDCSGVARGIYAKAGHRLGTVDIQANDTRVLFEYVRAHGSLRRSQPLPGDLVFFDNTYDQNKNGRTDDPLSHVGVVERVDSDGTVILVHRVGKSVVRARMNLDRPHDRHDDDGKPLNHYLRAASGAAPARTTAELFVAFGSVDLAARALQASR